MPGCCPRHSAIWPPPECAPGAWHPLTCESPCDGPTSRIVFQAQFVLLLSLFPLGAPSLVRGRVTSRWAINPARARFAPLRRPLRSHILGGPSLIELLEV